MDPLDVVVCTSANYSEMYDIFLASLRPKLHEITLHSYTMDLSEYAEIGFRKPSWYKALEQKLKNLYSVMTQRVSVDKYIVVTDADIQYFRPEGLHGLVKEAQDSQLDWYGMREDTNNSYNGGFYIIKNYRKMQALIWTVVDRLQQGEKPPLGDQTILNELLFGGTVLHKFIPEHQYVWGPRVKPNTNPIFHHAVCTTTVQQKLAQMKSVREKVQTVRG